MQWLLKFIPINTIIDYICDFAIKQFASKTTTELDDKAIDEVMRPLLKEWLVSLTNPSVFALNASVRNSLLTLIDFASTDIKLELLEKLQDK